MDEDIRFLQGGALNIEWRGLLNAHREQVLVIAAGERADQSPEGFIRIRCADGDLPAVDRILMAGGTVEPMYRQEIGEDHLIPVGSRRWWPKPVPFLLDPTA
ncbi:MAG TPA: hypothetical protein VKG92_05515, partial [Flavobacteriales bacterium]|nr:hypothetical protein [Flavobacteriales bacterium]